MKIDLQNKNKYVGKRIKKRDKFKTRVVAGILSGALIGGCLVSFLFPKLKDILVKNVLINSHYFSLDDEYSKMSVEDKNEYVSNLFCSAIDSNDEFSALQKEELKENIAKFLGEWGYLYKEDNLRQLESSLLNVDLRVDDRLIEEDNMFGCYSPLFGKITLDDSADIGTLSHEVTHVITADIFQYLSFNNLVIEAITSSIDQDYYGNDSYIPLIRSQVLFLSEIIGRENLLYCYVNCDSDSLKKFIGNDNIDLLELLQEEYLGLYSEDLFLSKETVEGIVMKLKDMYESKYGRKVNEDAIIYAIYQSCLPNSGYSVQSTLFYKDQFEFSYDGREIVFDVSKRDCVIQSWDDYFQLMSKEDMSSYNHKIVSDLQDDYFNGIKDNNILNKFKVLFGDEVYFGIFDSDDVMKSLECYLEQCGVKSHEVDVYIYKMLNDDLSDEDWALLYYHEFKRLYDIGRLDIAVSDMKILVGGSKGEDILKKIVMSDQYLSMEILNRYLGFYWEDKDYCDKDNSVIGYNYVCDNDSIILPNNGMEYEFYDGGDLICPKGVSVDNDFTKYEFDGDSSIYIVGNRDRYTCKELGIYEGYSRTRNK